MPKALERKLRAEARKKFPGDKKRQDRYVYGTLRKQGWIPSTQKKKSTARKRSKKSKSKRKGRK